MLLALGLAGQGVRWWLSRPGQAPGQVELLQALPPRSPLAHRDSVLALARPLAPGERLDADRASAAELARLPRVGPALAKAIVADREARGPFGSLEGLDRVPGIGPALLAAVGAHVTFGGGPAAAVVVRAEGGAGEQRAGGTASPLDLNTAGAAELDRLPGIGPARAAAIVRERQAGGRFATVGDLARVPGIGPAALARLKGLVTVR